MSLCSRDRCSVSVDQNIVREINPRSLFITPKRPAMAILVYRLTYTILKIFSKYISRTTTRKLKQPLK